MKVKVQLLITVLIKMPFLSKVVRILMNEKVDSENVKPDLSDKTLIKI